MAPSRPMMRMAARAAAAAARQRAAAAARQRSTRAGYRSEGNPLTEQEVKLIVSKMIGASRKEFSSTRELFRGLVNLSTSAATFMLLFAYVDKCADSSFHRMAVYLHEREKLLKLGLEPQSNNNCTCQGGKDAKVRSHDSKELAGPTDKDKTGSHEATD